MDDENPTFHEKCSYLECNFWRNVHIVKLQKMSDFGSREIHAHQGFSGNGAKRTLLRTDAECLFHTRSAFVPHFARGML